MQRPTQIDPKRKAYTCSRTRKGGWAIAQSPILTTIITLERLGKRGYACMIDYYEKVSPMFNEPLYPDKIGTQWCERLSLPCFAWWGRLLDYAQGFIVVSVSRFLKYSKISAFVIFDNFSLNLSRC